MNWELAQPLATPLWKDSNWKTVLAISSRKAPKLSLFHITLQVNYTVSKRTLDGFLSSSVFVIPVSAFTGAPLAAISIQSKMIHTRQ